MPDENPADLYLPTKMSPRAARVANAIREEVSRILIEELADPRLGFLTVTRAEISPDLLDARVYLSVLGREGERHSSLRALESARSHVQRLLNDRLELRRAVRLAFVYDPSVERSAQIAELIRQARAGDPDGGKGEEGQAVGEASEEEV